MQDAAEGCHRDGALCTDLQFNTCTEYRRYREDNGSDLSIGGSAPTQLHTAHLRVPGLPQDALQRFRLVRPTGKNCSLRSRMAKKFALQDKLGSLCHSAWARRALSVTLLGAINGGHCEPPGKMGELMEWARILAYISGTVDQELLLRNEYLAAENQILRGQLKGRPKLSDAERAKIGEFGRRL